MKGDGGKTAKELMDELARDPAHQARVAEREAARKLAAEESTRAAEPVVRDLNEAGFDVERVSDLFNEKRAYTAAIPVLAKWLSKVENPGVKEDIVRALSVPAAKSVARPLLFKELRRTKPTDAALRWALANALEVLADEDVFEELAALAQEGSLGEARQMVVLGLGKTRDARAVDVLVGLLGDDEVAGHAVMALGRLGDPAARDDVTPFLEHREAWVRREAKKALGRMG